MLSARYTVLPLLWAFLFVFLLVLPNVVDAQQSAGVGLKPATIEEPMEPGESRDFSVTVSNLSSTEQTLYLFTRNISGVRAGGVPIFAAENAEVTGYEITEWVSLPESEIVIDGNSSRQISFTISVPDNASPGSHFGGVFVSVEPPRLRSSGAAIGYEVASILSIRVAGEAVEKAQIRSFSTNNFIYGSPNVEFTAVIENQGNVLLRPNGPLEITNMFGSVVATLNFNENLAGVFPMTERPFDLVWEDEGTGFGRYEARLSLIYGSQGKNQTVTNTVSFWVLPMDIILPAALVLTVLLGGTYLGIKLYVKRKLAYYGGGRRLVSRRRRGGSSTSTGLLVFIVMLSVTAIFLIVLLALYA